MDITETPMITRTRGLSRVTIRQRSRHDPAFALPTLADLTVNGEPLPPPADTNAEADGDTVVIQTLASLSLPQIAKLGVALGAPGVDHANGLATNRRALLAFLLATYDRAGRQALADLLKGTQS